MSDTPRVDNMRIAIEGIENGRDRHDDYVDMLDFARKLERELAKEKRESKTIKKELSYTKHIISVERIRHACAQGSTCDICNYPHAGNKQYDALDMFRDEFIRIKCTPDCPSEIAGLCNRAISGIERKVPLIKDYEEIREISCQLHSLIEPAKRALAVVSQFKMCVLSPEEFFMEICGKPEPIAQLQELYDTLAKALDPFEDKQPGCGHFGVNT